MVQFFSSPVRVGRVVKAALGWLAVLLPLGAVAQSSLSPDLMRTMTAEEAVLPRLPPALQGDALWRSNFRASAVPNQPAHFTRFRVDDPTNAQATAPTCQMACNAEPRCKSYWVSYNLIPPYNHASPAVCHLSEGPDPHAGSLGRLHGVKQASVVPSLPARTLQPPFKAEVNQRGRYTRRFCFEDGRCVTGKDNAGRLGDRHHQADYGFRDYWVGELTPDGGKAVAARGTGELVPLSAEAYAERRAGSAEWQIKRFDGVNAGAAVPCRSLRSEAEAYLTFLPEKRVRSGALCFENAPWGGGLATGLTEIVAVSGAVTPIDGAGVPGHTYRDARLVVAYDDFNAVFHKDGGATLTDSRFNPIGDRVPLALFVHHDSLSFRINEAKRTGASGPGGNFDRGTLALELDQTDPWGRPLWQVLDRQRGTPMPEGLVGAVPLFVFDGVCPARMMAVPCRPNLIGWALEWRADGKRWQTLAGVDGRPVSEERYEAVFIRTGAVDRVAMGVTADGRWDVWTDEIDRTSLVHYWAPLQRGLGSVREAAMLAERRDGGVVRAAADREARAAALAAQERAAKAAAFAKAQAEAAAANAAAVEAAMRSGNRDQLCGVARIAVTLEQRQATSQACREIQTFQAQMAAERSKGIDWVGLNYSLSANSRRVTGAPPLSSLEQDYYVGRGYVVVRRDRP